ncbi:DUF4279 domain-containing protein [Paenibacillus pedocola]|uniref:DUF4279 domain-containing protein n=1 Tax=Paenibacillus pedocola TaxID=3242193 RepID=UPI002877B7FD|nr:DUF4279 domain-containing protein [Paenibacillus typhae]
MTGSFSFSIYDDSLDFGEISTLLHTPPSSVIKKGEKLKRGSTVAPYDSWHLQEKFQGDGVDEAALVLLLQKLTPFQKEIAYLQQKYQNVILNTYLQSNFGQVGFNLSAETIRQLSLTGLEMGIHILSYGGVEE